MRIAFLASHNGSSAKAITDACKAGLLSGIPVLLISNNPSAAAFGWARDAGLKTLYISEKTEGSSENLDEAIAAALLDHSIDLVVLSGYMRLIGPQTIRAGRHILNVHPGLLPQYGGKGMYGRHVHKAVIKNQEKETGITIHLVDEIYDHGAVIAQKRIPVEKGDTAETLENRVKSAEPDFYIETLKPILSGTTRLP